MTATATEAPSGQSPEGALYFSPRGLYPFQADHIARIYLGIQSGIPEWMIVWDTGLGKAEPISEPVLTPVGWVPMGDLRVGHQVIAANGRPAKILAVHPQESREVYRVAFSDGSWTRCSPEHLWTVSYWGPDRSSGKQVRVRRSKTVTLRQLMAEGVTTPKGRRKFSIPMTAPVQYPERNLPMDPYALGVVLGDGNVNPRGYVSLTTDKEIIDALAVPGSRYEHRSAGVAVLNTNAWREVLTGLGLAGRRAWEKSVPEIYLRAPEDSRRALLAGLLDTDGSPIEEGGVEFSTTSEALLDAVIELTESLGGQARSKSSRFTTYTHNEETKRGRKSWRVNVKLNEQPFRLARKMIRWTEPTKYPVQRIIESIERVEDEDSVCITIDRSDGLYLTRSHIVTHNSHAAMRLTTLGFEDDAVDFVLLVCERGKLKEWQADFEEFTTLDTRIHHGPSRNGKLAKLGLPQVLITTFETGKADLVVMEKTGRKRRTFETGPLLTRILEHSRRPMIIFDEADRLSNRSAANYRAYEHVLRTFRKVFKIPVLMLTGTPIRRDWEGSFNQLRLLRPASMPLVGEFEKYFVRGRDDYGRARYHDYRMPEFANLCSPMLLAKSKTDPDVIAQFPVSTEEAFWVDLEGEQRKFYDFVAELDAPGQMAALRQICAHPAALLHSATEGKSKLARALVDEFGEDYIRSLPSAKTDALVRYVEPIVKGQDAKVLVFTFFGPSVIPHLRAALTARHVPVFTHDDEDGIENFKKHPGGGVLLASDAVARGINLPEASYLIEYDVASTFGLRTQRLNRASRIGKGGPTLTIRTMLARESLEIALLHNMLEGNAQADALLGHGVDGSEFMTAAMRRKILTEGMGE
jgi:hypothetical protein